MANNDVFAQAQALAKQSGIADYTLESIRSGAENNRQMQTPTAEKQQIYDMFQNYYKDMVIQGAQQGNPLVRPNEWKQSIWNQHADSSLLTPDAYLERATSDSNSKMASFEEWLKKSADSQLSSQEATLKQTLDQQLAQLDLALQEAINQGQLSIKEAEAQYQKAQQQIYQQAYRDSELTNLVSHDRGIQDSAQMVGLMQGDQARRNSLLNENLTTRDQQINAINNQLAQMEYQTGVNKALANSQYGTGLAQAQGDIFSQMYQNMANMSFEEWQRVQDQGFQLSLNERNQNFQEEQVKQQQQFDLEKLSVQQKYAMEQMAKQFGYDMNKLSVQQQYALSQMAEQFGYDMQKQASQQAFDKSILQMQQSHDYAMLDKETQAQMDTYALELSRELASYQEGTPEYKLREFQLNYSLKAAQAESTANLMAELGNTRVAQLLESVPTMPSAGASQKDIDAYNKQVTSINSQLKSILGSDSAQSFLIDTMKAKGVSQEKQTGIMSFLKSGLSIISAPFANVLKGITP